MKDLSSNVEAAAVDLSSEAFVVVGADGRIVEVSDSAKDMLLYSGEELIGAEIEILVPKRFACGHKDVRRIRSARGTTRATGLVEGIGARRSDGSEIPIDVRLSRNEKSGQVVVHIREGDGAGDH